MAEAVAAFVEDGLRFGFDLGVDVSRMRGKRHFRNYPSAVEAREAVSRSIAGRVAQQKSVLIGKNTRPRASWATSLRAPRMSTIKSN